MEKKRFKEIQKKFVESPLFSMFQIFDKYPRTVYKYRNWEDNYHKKILTDNEIFLSPPNLFNDPFDCRIYDDYSWVYDEQKRNAHIEKSLIENKDYIIKEHGSIEKGRKLIVENFAYPVIFQARSEKSADDFNDKHIGIVSFAENCDSILMWSHYANHHKGFSVGFDERKLKVSGLFDLCESVIYSEEMPNLYIDDRRTKKINVQLHKSIEWEYEREYRAISLFNNEQIKKPSHRIVNFNDSYIKEIVFGLLTPEEHKKEIAEIAKNKNIPLFEMKKIPLKFKLIKMPYED
ncbi:DUF2971 domain-containing protein [Flavobacterium frigidarium]|uniref:DUF2971 domain-containing protein n=1 Tax=Flavobacterium frigidarium TaxID=99286 RepID=UPI0003F8D25D|nr:DUF2971 domain-containing protein [Flavobacterium frigidarium]